MAKRKQVTLKFQATEKDFNNQIEKIQAIVKEHDLMSIEYGNINFEGITIKIDKLMNGMM